MVEPRDHAIAHRCRGADAHGRSGETPVDFIADLAGATGCGQRGSGAPARGERVANHNRVLFIHHATRLPYGR